MKTQLPKKFLKSKYRRELWQNAKRVLKRIERALPISSAYIRGSFTTKKKRPADVDFILVIKTKDHVGKEWAIDVVIVPDNAYGKAVVKDADLWMKQKYGAKNSVFLKLK